MSRAGFARLLAWAVWLSLLAPPLAGCENGPILRGAGSEHHQTIRVGLPF